MKVAVFRAVGQPLQIKEADIPKPGPGLALIRNARCGVCGTDVHMTSGHGMSFPAGLVPGHEVAGEVVELGAGVTGLKVGDRVAPHGFQNGCGVCAACLAGAFQFCSAPQSGASMNGFGQYGLVRPEALLRLPQSLTLEDGALIEPMACALHAVDLSGMAPGARVLVLGAGVMGLGVAYWSRMRGAAKVVVMSRSRRREEMAMRFGATAFVEGPDAEDAKARSEAALGGPPDIVIECVGATGMLAAAIDHVRLKGVVVSLGFCTSPDTIMPVVAFMKEVRLHFSLLYSLRDYEAVASTFDAGRVDMRDLVTETVSLAELPAAFEALRGPNEQTKLMVDPWAGV
jgi:2-desacetyl-2-hydroxyethyl bacteriochlorophyllide A dehydrogenase